MYKTILVLLALPCAVALPPQFVEAEEPRPNFVVIMADDLGYGDLSCYDGWIETPALDQLASKAVKMTDFHSSGNVCSPTRAGLLTGRYQQRAGIPGVIFADPSRPQHDHGLQPEEVTFAELLQADGYATGMTGKWHLGYTKNYNPIRNGFDRFVGYVSGNVDYFSHVDQAGNFDWWHQDQHQVEEGYSTHLITKHSVQFIRDNADKPFCHYFAHEAPHYPYQGPNDSAEREVGGSFKTQGTTDEIKSAYHEMVTEMDHGVGEIMSVLEELDLSERTIVFFFSDNGANQRGSNKPFRGNKGSNWEGGHRVPCLVSWPGVLPEGGRCDQLAISLDIMPTLLAASGIESPTNRKLDGIDLLPYLRGDRSDEERKLFWNGKAMRHGSWKLINTGRGADGFQLFDLSVDIAERNNLRREQPERFQAMKRELAAWTVDVESTATPQPTR